MNDLGGDKPSKVCLVHTLESDKVIIIILHNTANLVSGDPLRAKHNQMQNERNNASVRGYSLELRGP